MTFLVSHMSAADFWRTVYPVNRAPGISGDIFPSQMGECSLRRLGEVAPAWMTPGFTAPEDGRLHLLTRDAQALNRTDRVVGHLWTRRIPGGSFFRYSNDVYIASPAFSLLQLAPIVSFGQLVALGNEFCGKYSLDSRDKRGFRKRLIPLTTPETLRGYLQSAKGLPGARTALRALDFVGANAESPMETTTWILLRSTYHHGGYGIEPLAMNQEVPLPASAATIAGKGKCRADLQVVGTKLVIEYLGKNDHLGEESFYADRRRTNALTEVGYEVVELSIDQVRDWKTFEAIALRAARVAGKRIKQQHRGPLPARMGLRNELFTWNALSGRPAS